MVPLASFNPRKFRFKRWQLLFLLLIVVCGVAYSIKLTQMSVVWDETVHLEGGLLLSQGKLYQYVMFTRYPPLMDALTAGYFWIFGANVFAARLVSVTFSLLTIAAVFAFASKAYGRRVAFVSSAILATMPGFIFLSRVSLLEMTIEFFFVAVLLLFLLWLRNGKNSIIVICGMLLGLATLTKYQAIVAGLVLVAALPVMFYRSKFQAKISRFPLLLIAAAIVIVPFLVSIYSSGILGQWIGLLQSSDTQVNVYGARFPLPIFYMLEMTVPLDYVHPIYLPVFILGLVGLGFFVWRRKPEDKLLLVMFAVVYVFFTLVGTKSWRYVLPMFPVLAISAACLLVTVFGRLQRTYKSAGAAANKKLWAKVLAGFLIVFSVGALVASTADAYNWLSIDTVYVPLPETIHYVAQGLGDANESVMIVCGVNVVSQKASEFYLQAYESKPNSVWLYPLEPADAYAPNFNITAMIGVCREKDVKYLLLYENRDTHYFDSTLTPAAIVEMMINSGVIYYQTSFGTQPNRIFVFQTNQTAMSSLG